MGMKLEGLRVDIVRTKNIQGMSPVGGSHGGTEGKTVCYLDEFEKQAGHYHMVCAHAQLGNGKRVSFGSISAHFFAIKLSVSDKIF